MYKNKKAIIWDWNGTLLNDIDICIECMNRLLDARNLDTLEKVRYRDIFTFPVREYYRRLGFNFDFEEFEKPAIEFIDLYYENLHRVDLFDSVPDVLSAFKERDYHQSILSAMEHERLLLNLKAKNVFPYFDQVAGIEDHYAHSKLEIGKDLMNKINFKPEEILLIGDTIHDFEVANGLGVEALLVAKGHQSKKRLLKKTSNVVDDFSEILHLL
jgi:phosphoglycolate phosphatase